MLSEKNDIVPLNAVRKQDIQDRVPEYVGKEHLSALLGGAIAVNGLCSMVCGKKGKVFCHLVDQERMKALREKAKAASGSENISANDVITSGFSQVVRPRLMTMAINFRGRIEGISLQDAGNYHSGLLYDAEGYREPAAIRASLQGPPPMSRAALPCCCDKMCCKMSMITNWSSMSKGDLCIPNCKQTLHVPLVKLSECVWDMAVVFTPRQGELAIMFVVKTVGLEQLKEGLPLSEPVSPQMFG